MPDLPLATLANSFAQRLMQEMAPTLATMNLDLRMVSILAAISADPGQTQAHYARALGIDLNTFRRQIDRLQSEGWLLRKTDPRDRRANRLELTLRGQATLRNVAPVIEQSERQALAHLPPSDQQALRRYLSAPKQTQG
ncbi:MAG: MarR family winged helix-turn-helix transcriptional regulator [Shimia sp.]